MRGLRSILCKSDERRVGQYWDEVVRRAPATPLPYSEAAASAGETIRLIQGLEDRTPRHAPFADRQLQMLLARHQEMNTMNAQTLTIPLGRPTEVSPEPIHVPDVFRVRQSRRQWLPALSGLAVLAVVVVLSLALAIFASLPGRHNDQRAIFAPSSPTAKASPSSSASASLVWTYTGVDKNALKYPTAVTIGPDGNVWVVDGMNNRIVILDPDGNFVNAWGAEGRYDGEFLFSTSMTNDAGELAFSPDGSIYVAEAAAARIQRFTHDFRYVMSWSGTLTPNTSFAFLTGIAVDRDGNVWATDTMDASVSKFSPEGKYLLTIGGVDSFKWTGSIGFDREGNLLVADGRGTVDVFNLDGKLLRTLVLNDNAGNPIVDVSDISTDSSGNMYVVGGSTPTVYVFDPNGSLLLSWSGEGDQTLKEPWIVAADGQGNMYIDDFEASAVQKVHIDLP